MKKRFLAMAIVIVLVVFSACEIVDKFDVHKIARRASVQPVFYIPVLKATFTEPLDTETKMSKEDIENLVKSYNELQKKFSQGKHKAPEEYDVSAFQEANIPEDDELFNTYKDWAKQNGISQSAFEELASKFVDMAGAEAQQAEVSYQEEYKKLGVYYIAPAVYDEEPIHSKFPIRSIDDMKGKKGRFVGAAGKFMNKLGARVTPMATAEVYSALEKGVIDFADRGGLPANYDVGLYEVAKYIVLPGFHQPVTACYYAANLDAWNKLPKDIQAILECAAREAAADLFQLNKTRSMEALKKFKEKGVEVIYLPEADTMKARKVAMEVWEEYAKKSPFAQKVFDSQKAWMKELGLL